MNDTITRVPGEDLGWATPIAALAIGCACSATAVALVDAPRHVGAQPSASIVSPAPLHPSASAAPVAVVVPSPTPSLAAAAPAVCAPLAVVFDYAHENVPSKEAPRLSRLADWLAKNPAASVVLQGHADARGSEDENLGLSKHRARNVANALTVLGVDPKRMTASGFGSYQPVEGLPEDASANRRVVVIIKGASECPSFVEEGKAK